MTDDRPALDPVQCRRRQRRVLECLERLSVPRAIFVAPENVHYLTGFLPHRLLPTAVALDAEGRCVLCAAATDSIRSDVAADEVVAFDAQWHATLRQERNIIAVQSLARSLHGPPAERIAVEFTRCGAASLATSGFCDAGAIDIDPALWRLRRRKDPDELAMIRHAIRCTDRMYATAQDAIEPGITELDLFGLLHAAAVDVAGEPLTALGNDFQCGGPGGSPRRRPAERGELFILDLGPAYRRYHADNCRTFSVDRRPTDAQYEAWRVVVSVLRRVEETVRPGVSCRAVFEQAKAELDAHRPGGFPHHLGHGIGLEPHEAPHLSPHWDDVFQEGDVFTAEPGLYSPELRAGIRLEENYLVTATGVERLTTYPLDL